MGIDIYHLDTEARRQIRIGHSVHDVGVIRRLWKNTETGLRQDRIDALEDIDDAQAARTAVTPPVVMVDDIHTFGGQGEIRAFRLLGWHRGRLKTQDYDWDHMPTVAWAVDASSGPLLAHEEVDGRLVPLSLERARALAILMDDARLAEHLPAKIVKCLSVERLGGGSYGARCLLSDGRTAAISGESESGELPEEGWFAGRDTAGAARYRLVEQLARKPSP